MDAVLPLRRRDLDRYTILARSLARFVTGLDTLYIVVPSPEREALSPLERDYGVRVLDERELIPELADFESVKGWYRQQLVKLAIASRVRSQFYLTLDADVIATRPVDLRKLVADGRAPCVRSRDPVHESWYRQAERVLGLRGTHRNHNITPALLARPAVRKLQRFLRDGIDKRRRTGRLPGLLRAAVAGSQESWRTEALRALPWTEYALYYTFLEGTGLFDRYHVDAEVHNRLSQGRHSLWHPQDVASWDPSAAFAADAEGFFIVAQSNTGISSETIWGRVARFLA